LNRLEYSLTFAYRVKSKLLIGPIFGGAYIGFSFLFVGVVASVSPTATVAKKCIMVSEFFEF